MTSVGLDSNQVFEFLFAGAQPFVWHPGRAWLVAGAFLLAGAVVRAAFRGRKWTWPLLASAVAWFLFGCNEYVAHARGWDIRVDLLFGWPVLLVWSIASVVLCVYPPVGPRSGKGPLL